MRELAAAAIAEEVAALCQRVNCRLPEDVRQALAAAREREESPLGRRVLAELLANAQIAEEEGVPLCQDTGLATFFVELGSRVRITGGSLEEAIAEGVRRGYREGYLRPSVVADPLNRRNTGDNTPPVVHLELVEGENLRLRFLPKGGGSENAARLFMLPPAAGREGVIRAVAEAVELAGPNACPPVVVGVGLGGTAEQALLLAKKALLRPLTEPAEPLEEEILTAVNRLGIGPQGFGGRVTALAVRVLRAPTHIACLPVGVSLSCHALRRGEVVL